MYTNIMCNTLPVPGSCWTIWISRVGRPSRTTCKDHHPLLPAPLSCYVTYGKMLYFIIVGKAPVQMHVVLWGAIGSVADCSHFTSKGPPGPIGLPGEPGEFGQRVRISV